MKLNRWLQLIFLSYPIQVVFMLVYPLLHLYWRLFIFKETKEKSIPVHDNPPYTQDHTSIRDMYFHNNQDDHGAYTHAGLLTYNAIVGRDGLDKLIAKDGTIYRRYSSQGVNAKSPSGDVIVFWVFAYAILKKLTAPEYLPKEALNRLAISFLKNLGALGKDDNGNEHVSAKSGCFGLMKHSDVWTGPAAGPQYYVVASVFALAAKELGFKWKVVFLLHWLLYGGWYWWFSPVLYTKSNNMGYVRDVTMKALFTMMCCFGDRWWIIKPMKFITNKISESENALFYSMLDQDLKQIVCGIMNVGAWQRVDSVSLAANDPASNIWVNKLITNVRIIAHQILKENK